MATGMHQSSIGKPLADAVHVGPDGRGRFAADAALQSWPGIVHGGGLVAALDEAATRLGLARGARRVEGRLTSSVPIATSLELHAQASGDGVTVSILQNGQPLTTGFVTVAPGVPDGSSVWLGGAEGTTLPMSDLCLACGARNPIGLKVALDFDDTGVWARLSPPPAWRIGRAFHPALAPVLMDEVAWWLGALVMKEGGLTNRIGLTWLAPADADGDDEVVCAGRFEEVLPVDRRRTFWRVPVTLSTGAGRLLAVASIVFRGGPEYSGRQLEYFRARVTPEVFRRMFPSPGEAGGR